METPHNFIIGKIIYNHVHGVSTKLKSYIYVDQAPWKHTIGNEQ